MKTKTTKFIVQFQSEYGIWIDDAPYDSKSEAIDHYDALKAADPSARILKRTVIVDEVIVG